MSHAFETIFAPARPVMLERGQALFHAGETVRDMYLVRTGHMQLLRHTSRGICLVLQNATAGMVLAEASAYAHAYHCDAVATCTSCVVAVPRPAFRTALERDPALAQVWSKHLAEGVQAARFRAELRTLPRVVDRLEAWLAEGNTLPEKGRWQDVASELGITREALYRELARRRNG
ncbi:Crp/Fnr family transcriptional regulator [Roseinatronobacter sp. NSM]|uniref:Crp/Fnr family transcriptional regulator n=1 Tax=Roseinatronobacter sp. NSM TaxID=3457785 RepID=UPI004036C30C